MALFERPFWQIILGRRAGSRKRDGVLLKLGSEGHPNERGAHFSRVRRPPARRPVLVLMTSHWLSLLGMALVGSALISWLFVLPLHVLVHADNPYIGILVFLVIPIVLVLGLGCLAAELHRLHVLDGPGGGMGSDDDDPGTGSRNVASRAGRNPRLRRTGGRLGQWASTPRLIPGALRFRGNSAA